MNFFFSHRKEEVHILFYILYYGLFVARTVTVLSSYSANAAIDNMEADGRGHIKNKSPLFTELGRSKYDSWPSLQTLIYTSGRTIFDFFFHKELQILTIDHISL